MGGKFWHQLQAGSKTVLSLRVFSDKEGVADSQYFTKITGYLGTPGILEAKKINLEGAHFSSGWSGFAYKGDFWVSTDVNINIKRLPDHENIIEIIGLVDATNHYRRESKGFEIRFTCELSRMMLAELSPWQGATGDIWSSFYP